jgi:hypothetical protein
VQHHTFFADGVLYSTVGVPLNSALFHIFLGQARKYHQIDALLALQGVHLSGL